MNVCDLFSFMLQARAACVTLLVYARPQLAIRNNISYFCDVLLADLGFFLVVVIFHLGRLKMHPSISKNACNLEVTSVWTVKLL